MSAPDLLVVVDPAARHIDGESVRIARDVLSAGPGGVKMCLPRSREEIGRMVGRRGRRRPVLVGDDTALLCAVEQLHREGTGAQAVALGVVPVGPPGTLPLAEGMGLPLDAVTAARAVLAGADRVVDLLVDETGAVLLGGVRIPAAPAGGPRRTPVPAAPASVLGPLGRCAARVWPGRRGGALPLPRLRVEADGVVLADPGSPVAEVSVRTGPGGAGGGLAEVVVRPADAPRVAGAVPPVRARARAVTVSGPEFRTRTWTVSPSALRLTLPLS
ncbi:diacylglycerol kinase [Streptomyces chumphonensis]|uniref:diacylglycerol kinase n=1 Tax=Streptomyces chumphonensis TaxID=1214925 RepID=UPI003D73A8CC